MDQNANIPGTTPPSPPLSPVPEKKSVGALIGSIIVILVILAGGIYMFLQRERASDTVQNEDPEAQTLRTQGTSDDPADIEADLRATDFGSIDSGMAETEAQFQ